uniref:Uncharacterized protein n=1 Tax=Populus trichocarpa TaxID=3694 RepID=U7DWD9_POPTR
MSCSSIVFSACPVPVSAHHALPLFPLCGISILNLVDIIFHVFDANRDGNLSSDEFVRVRQGRETASPIPREPGLKRLMSCCANCAKNYSPAKRLL